MPEWLLGGWLQAAACLAAGLPFVILALWQARSEGRQVSGLALALLGLYFAASLSLRWLPPLWPFQKTLWQAMIFEAALALAVIAVARSCFDAGLRVRIPPAAWRACLLAALALVSFVAARSLSLKLLGLSPAEKSWPSAEYFLFQLTMPGIAEELVYRGVIQSGLNSLFGKPWRLWGAPLGWGWVITSVLFWGIHAFRLGAQSGLWFYWPTLTMQLVVGFVLGWMRERSESLLPPALAHNLANIVWTVV